MKSKISNASGMKSFMPLVAEGIWNLRFHKQEDFIPKANQIHTTLPYFAFGNEIFYALFEIFYAFGIKIFYVSMNLKSLISYYAHAFMKSKQATLALIS